MSRVLNLRRSASGGPSAAEPEQPTAELVAASAIPHPVVQEQKIITDTGETLPYATLRWTAPSHAPLHSAKVPLTLAALLGVGAILIALFQQEYVTAGLFGLLAIMTVVHVRRGVSYHEVELSPLNIRIDDRSYGFHSIKSFWVHYEPEYGVRELSLHLKKWHSPYVKIQIADQDPVQIRAILLEFIPEEEHEETFAHTLARRLGL